MADWTGQTKPAGTEVSEPARMETPAEEAPAQIQDGPVKKEEAADTSKPAAAPSPPQAVPAPATGIAVPPPEVLLMLVRTTLVALNQANFTGNYTVLHGLGTPALQARHTPADLGTVFMGLRAQGLDLSPVLVLSPQVTEGPSLGEDGRLQFKGLVRALPLQIEFAMAFLPVAGRWRVDGLAVAAVPAPPEPVAPPAETAQVAEPKVKTPEAAR